MALQKKAYSKTSQAVISIFLIGVFILFGCSESSPPEKIVAKSIDPNIEANKLFVETSSIMKGLRESASNYSEALILYNTTKDNLSRITSNFPSSNLAVVIATGEKRFFGLSQSEFDELGLTLQALAEAEKNPLICTKLLQQQIEEQLEAPVIELNTSHDIGDKLNALIRLSNYFFEIGEKNKSEQTLTIATEVSKLILDKNDQYFQLGYISAEYAKNGLYSKASQVIRTIPDESFIYKSKAIIKTVGNCTHEKGIEVANQLLLKAIYLARIIDNYGTLRGSILLDVSSQYIRLGQTIKAKELLDEVLQFVSEGKSTMPGFDDIAIQYAELGEFSKALKVAKKIKDESRKSYALTNISREFARAGQFAEAITLIDAIKDNFSAKRMLAIQYAKSDKFSNALIVAETIKKSVQDYEETLVYIAEEYVRVGQLAEATRLIETIKITTHKADGTLTIAEGYAKAKNQKMADQLFTETLQLVWTIRAEDKMNYRLVKLAASSYKYGLHLTNTSTVSLSDIVLKLKPIRNTIT